jgi:hypothetical protein
VADAVLDVASQLATAWNSARAADGQAGPVDVWPCCQILAAAGLLQGQERDLAAVELGPFRIAVTGRANATRDFIEVLFPAAVAALPTGQPLTGAISGALSAACLTFIKLLERTIVFGRSETDQQRWIVLIHIKNCNASGVFPTVCDVIDLVTRASQWDIRPNAVESSIVWLTGAGDARPSGRRTQLVRLDSSNGGLESLV